MRIAALLVCLAACSVPGLSLEGKQCPCVEVGYVCDTLTNRCLATNDGGAIIDTPAATQCLSSPANETEIYRYEGTFDWQHEDASWMASGTEIAQTSSQVMDSYTYKTSSDLTAAPDVHVISSMRQVMNGTGTPSLGIVLRAQLSPQTKSRYTCSWISKNRELRVEATQGGSASALGTATVGGSDVLPTSFTMEASVTGSTLSCCIREISAARVTMVVDSAMTVATGYPGLQTDRMQAAFGSFVVLKPN
jgi:hypothetical protein